MTDLDQLAAASRHSHSSAAPAVASPSARRPRAKGGVPAWAWAAGAAGIVVIVGIILVVAKGSQKRAPGFTAIQRSQSGHSSWIEIVNQENDPLVIKSVRVNGEVDTTAGKSIAGEIAVTEADKPWPRTIGIGEKVCAIYWAYKNGPNYTKQLVTPRSLPTAGRTGSRVGCWSRSG